MGLLDSLLGALSTGPNASQPGQGSALTQQLSVMLTGSATTGGLGDLVKSFETNGLSHIVGSWIGAGPNLAITAEQVQQVLGSGKIAAMAQSVGIQPAQLAQQLTQLLPQLVNHVTPNGQVPAAGVGHVDVAGALSSLLSGLAPGTAQPAPT